MKHNARLTITLPLLKPAFTDSLNKTLVILVFLIKIDGITSSHANEKQPNLVIP